MEWDHNKLLLLDGGMGTMLMAAGMKIGEIPELLNVTNGSMIRDIQRKYVQAGSRVIYANTFGANRHKLQGTGHTVTEVILAGVSLARQAAEGRDVAVALDIGPIGELLEPMGTLSFEEAYELFSEMVIAGDKAGADLITVETMTDLYEAKAAVLAAHEHSSLPVFATMTFDADGRTFTGCTAEAAVRTLEGLGVTAVGLNCSLGPRQLAPLVREIASYTKLPVIVKPNAGLPDPIDGHYDVLPDEFAEDMRLCVENGASVIGGCCGTTPDYIRALSALADTMTPVSHGSKADDGCVCTPTRTVHTDGVRVIGERINPTGKKRFQQALLEKDFDYIVDVAVQEMDAGADVLDVNVGFPGVDEADMLPRVVKKLQAAVPLPLQLDSSSAAALEAGLRVYNGKAAVNSVNGKQEILDAILPVVKKYGAAVVGLTLDADGIPGTAQGRVAIAERILRAALDTGIRRSDVWIDCLTLTVSAQQEQAEHTLSALRTVHEELGLSTVLGVSNISFGLPNRPLMTQTFLVRALDRGLTLPIINPNQKEMMDAVAAFRVLSGEDRESRAYVDRFANAEAAPRQVSAASMTLKEAVVRGLQGEAGKLAKAMLKPGQELSLVEEHLIPALDQVGADYESGRAFLPQLLSAAQAAESVFSVIKASLASSGGSRIGKGRLAIATVQGDIHDIGKNIVRTVLENYGYEVIDLGRDVAPQTIADCVVSEKLTLVGLSALMTTTLPAMEETVALLKRLPEPPHVFVGGAVVTPEWAAQMGADDYAKDARQAVDIARKVLG